MPPPSTRHSGVQGLPGLDQVFVINVKSFEARRRHVEAELARFGIEAEFVHDWDIPDLNSDSERWFAADGSLSPGEKSCCMKHITALERIEARQYECALVLEDDVVLAPGFVDAVRFALEERRRFGELQVVFLGSGGNFYTPRKQRIPGQHLYAAHKGRFTDSYMLGAQTATARLNWMRRNRMRKPIDNTFDVIDRELDIAMLWYEDPVVEQGSKNGTFQSMLASDPPPWLKGIFFRWEKFRRRHLYQLWR